MFVKPKEGLLVQDPSRGDALPPEGREVEATQYWQRRLIDGDVVEAQAPAETASPAKAVAATKTDKE